MTSGDCTSLCSRKWVTNTSRKGRKFLKRNSRKFTCKSVHLEHAIAKRVSHTHPNYLVSNVVFCAPHVLPSLWGNFSLTSHQITPPFSVSYERQTGKRRFCDSIVVYNCHNLLTPNQQSCCTSKLVTGGKKLA